MKKPTLVEIQKAFEDAILYGKTDINHWVNADKRGDASKRMGIYQYAYQARLIDVMFIDYPTIHQILGDDMFYEACQAYLRAYPSCCYSVRWFGQNFSRFLAETEPYSEHEYLAEMAKFEWTKGLCFDGEDAEALDLSSLSGIEPDKFVLLKFRFVPTFRVMTCKFDTPTIWKSINQENDENMSIPTVLPYPIDWALWRHALSPSWLSLDVDHAWAIRQAIAGASFLEICDGLREWIDEEHIPNRMAGFVQTWLNEGMLCEITL